MRRPSDQHHNPITQASNAWESGAHAHAHAHAHHHRPVLQRCHGVRLPFRVDDVIINGLPRPVNTKTIKIQNFFLFAFFALIFLDTDVFRGYNDPVFGMTEDMFSANAAFREAGARCEPARQRGGRYRLPTKGRAVHVTHAESGPFRRATRVEPRAAKQFRARPFMDNERDGRFFLPRPQRKKEEKTC